MRILSISDLHLEFYKDKGVSLIEKLAQPADVLVLAGDILYVHDLDAVQSTFDRFTAVFPNIPIIYVPGNHDFWGMHPEETLNLLSKVKNVQVLYNDVFVYEDTRFVGTTLWFPQWSPLDDVLSFNMPDFKKIKGFREWVAPENKKAHDYLYKTVKPGDVVITHYLPSSKCTAPEFVGSAYNAFFVSPAEDVMVENKPRLWLHGHTHHSVDLVLHETRIYCNPYGYPHETNKAFNRWPLSL